MVIGSMKAVVLARPLAVMLARLGYSLTLPAYSIYFNSMFLAGKPSTIKQMANSIGVMVGLLLLTLYSQIFGTSQLRQALSMLIARGTRKPISIAARMGCTGS